MSRIGNKTIKLELTTCLRGNTVRIMYYTSEGWKCKWVVVLRKMVDYNNHLHLRFQAILSKRYSYQAHKTIQSILN